MKFKTTTGSIKRVKNFKKHFIDWEADSKSILQKKVKHFLFDFWRYDVVLEEFPIPGSLLSLDFFNANKRIAIEVQGGQHRKYIPYFHKRKGDWLNQQYRDADKFNFCDINNITLLEIEENDIPAQERRNSFPISQKFKDCIIEVIENKYNIDL